MMTIYIEPSTPHFKTIANAFQSHNYRISSNKDDANIYFANITTIKDIEKLTTTKPNYHFICLVNDNKLLFDVLDLNPLMIVRATRLETDLEACLQKLASFNPNTSCILEFKSGDALVRIPSSNIYYIESFLHYLIIHTPSAEFQVRESLSSAYQRMNKLGFIQIHKSYLVNRAFVSSICKDACLLVNNVSLPIGRKYKNLLTF